MNEIRPKSRRSLRLSIGVTQGLVPEQLVLRLRGRDERGARELETLLGWYEARKLAHALLDALQQTENKWPITIQLAHQHARGQGFRVAPSVRSGEPVTLTVVIRGEDGQVFAIPLSATETTQLGHRLLAEANPSRVSSGDD